MRGILRYDLAPIPVTRFIPADAGNTRRSCVARRRRSVHPRGCGEYLTRAAAQGNDVRFIPADAGNTSAGRAPARRLTVHPRGCGEYADPSIEPGALTGSSPRMRGIRCFRSWGLAPARFIPADAGNTETMERMLKLRSVHPRGCGEYAASFGVQISTCGSSPRMRGIRANASSNSPCLAVHPRGCGEYVE